MSAQTELDGKMRIAISYTKWAMENLDAPWKMVKNGKTCFAARGRYVWVSVVSNLGVGGYWRWRTSKDKPTSKVFADGARAREYAMRLNA